MKDTEKADYIRAVLCLGKKAPIAKSMKASMSRYDDFVAIHNKLTPSIHWVVSLPAFSSIDLLLIHFAGFFLAMASLLPPRL